MHSMAVQRAWLMSGNCMGRIGCMTPVSRLLLEESLLCGDLQLHTQHGSAWMHMMNLLSACP